MLLQTTIVSSILALFFIPATHTIVIVAETPKEAQQIKEVIIEKWDQISGEITAYTSDPAETDDTPDITASGEKTRDGIIACPTRYKFGTVVRIKGKEYVCKDRMNSRYWESSRFDIWVETKAEAYEIGLKRSLIEIKK